ncbi:NmrA/HSCARG family protein [Actinomycetospora lemnae]|uniref:NmrA/HSCARG family protein n=1 Tax=Actinomycetospora lemnae TaxID=3019891 RepID=A0ABT5SNE5_9PSEU|nr:NmrA/HSCARG family protein [Actinomycetospora sp. DW7H6]MDD7964365.1 NmrA/HSCARG family protein [Actinomycetospora sp. DW7H6]
MTTTYAVLGATGQQGGATARALLAAGVAVRALVRDPAAAAARTLAGAGADLVRADLTDQDSLRSAFSGVDGAFAMTTSFTPRGTEGETADGVRIADAARAAGLPHLVYSSVGGADRRTGIPHFESKRRVEEHIEGLDLAATFVRPVFFMENLSPTAEGGATILRLPLPADVPVQMVAVADIGRVAAAVLLDPSRVPGGAIEIAGDELTGAQAAEVLGGRYEALPVAVLDDPDLRAMFTWFVEARPAYQADFAATRALDPQVLDLAAWAAQRATA